MGNTGPTPTLASIIAAVEAVPPAQQTAVLLKHSSGALKTLLGYALDPNVKWLLPPTRPPFRRAGEAQDYDGNLYRECRKFIYFIDSPEGRKVTQRKREELFIQLLETVHPDDAELVLRVKDKALRIDTGAVKRAFPNLAKNW